MTFFFFPFLGELSILKAKAMGERNAELASSSPERKKTDYYGSLRV